MLAERVDHKHKKAEQVRGYVERAIILQLETLRMCDVEPADIARVVRAYRGGIARPARARTEGCPAARALLVAFKGLLPK